MRTRYAAALVMVSSVMVGCVSTPPTVVVDAQSQNFVDAIAMTCEVPYELTRDCGSIFGPSAKVEIHGVAMEIAGSEDGKLIVFKGGSVFDRRGEGNNEAYDALKTLLTENQIQITRVVPLVSANILMGYAVHTDVAAYDMLDPYRK